MIYEKRKGDVGSELLTVVVSSFIMFLIGLACRALYGMA